ncbi:hypothetical protein [Pseudooceanicola sp. 200-1SW]|uniref:hypothetical protein n=1 Tax=Pseudooceanicola sp. 200-1SW TaxID=3425949 RepID=UPI003D7F64B0
MNTNAPTREELRRAQAALDALNVAYEYFTPAPRLVVSTAAEAKDYEPYTAAA